MILPKQKRVYSLFPEIDRVASPVEHYRLFRSWACSTVLVRLGLFDPTENNDVNNLIFPTKDISFAAFDKTNNLGPNTKQ